MQFDTLVSALVGATFGSLGWLFVGLFMQGQQTARLVRNAARAVHVEIEMNRVSVQTALAYGSFLPLSRSAFERLLPELATSLTTDELRKLAASYICHAGYEQARQERDMPKELRQAALSGMVAAQDEALRPIGKLAFGKALQAPLAAVVTSSVISGSELDG